MYILLSFLPILIVLLFIFILKQSAIKSGLVGLAVTIFLSFTVGKFSLAYIELGHQLIEAFLLTVIVAYVLFFGLLLYHLINVSGLLKKMAATISTLTPDPLRQIIILTLGLSPLLESVSGFGLAMIVIAPILITLGIPRFKAVLISLVSLSAVPWGTLAMGTMIGANLGGISIQELGIKSALLSIPTFVYFAFIIIFIANGWNGVKEKGWEILFLSSSMGIVVFVSNQYISVELAGVLGAITVLILELFIIFFQRSHIKITKAQVKEHLIVFLPYLFLITSLLVSRIIPPLSRFLQEHVIWSLPYYQFSLHILYSPGFYLLITCLFVILFVGSTYQEVKGSIKKTLHQVTPVVFSIFLFVSISEIMAVATMTEIIGAAAAALLGSSFVAAAPFIGGVGGFLTGSNTSSNAIFMNLQMETASQLGLPANLIAAAQNTASAHVIMASPSRVVLAANLGEIKDDEHALMKKISLVALGTILILAVQVCLYYFFWN